ncbi:phosphate ABC transporter substrate-binding/OmpA family protein [Actibacterium sp. 188UL27-1]|uniref:phosphate ABC transporter substrate-binding/OmpA family protein n=1 Tax=Actibacterium sp. 188UL27-1 TaxID=2786961 RepID=UPI001959546B|nr:phosphate ABC transporter substrate-binding/OmpA family protein [Actibacterium sp. 188UL27-1]MBM7069374.1 substrate-binding domain-containing protein [Actibacterium sp. 188UL27-1]
MQKSLKFSVTAALMLTVAHVASADEVKLQSDDNSINLSGDLIDFKNGVYFIRTDLGALRISADRVNCIGAACPDLEGQEAVVNDQVRLRTDDGSIELEGRLVKFEDETYFVETTIGDFQLASDGVQCVGEACPAVNLDVREFMISSSNELTRNLIPGLVDGYADYLNASQERTTDASGIEAIQLASASGDTEATIQLASSDSATAFNQLVDGESTLAATTRAVATEELNQLIGLNADDLARARSENVLALDGLAIVVAPDNPVRAISEADIARIFSGEITNWAEIGGNDGPISLYARSKESGSGSVFFDLLMDPARSTMSLDAQLLGSDSDVADAVQGDPAGIGFTSFSTLGETRPLAIRGECGIQTPATDFTIKTEEYPLTRRLFMYRPGASIPKVASEFLDYTKTEEAQDIITTAGFVDQGVSAVSVNEQGLRFVASVLPSEVDVTYEQIQDMMLELAPADRVSLTYRFEQGSARLDTRAEADIIRLAEMIKRGDFSNKELLLIGFTDSIGLGDLNLELSRARAEQIRDELLQAIGEDVPEDVVIRATGYGEMSPLSCNDTLNGRQINRRVELWTKDIIRSSTSF